MGATILVLILLDALLMFLFWLFMRSRFSTDRILKDVRSEVDRLITDLGREADRDVGLLESRIQGLRALIDEADRRITLAEREESKRLASAALEASFREAQRDAAEQTIARSRRTPPAPAQAKPAVSAQQQLFQADQPVDGPNRSSSRSTPDAEARAVLHAEPPAEPRAEPPREPRAGPEVRVYARPRIRPAAERIEPVIPVRDRVLDLAKRGISAEMIANMLSVSLGEVELILDMNSSSL